MVELFIFIGLVIRGYLEYIPMSIIDNKYLIIFILETLEE